jgi:hypothetical protein
MQRARAAELDDEDVAFGYEALAAAFPTSGGKKSLGKKSGEAVPPAATTASTSKLRTFAGGSAEAAALVRPVMPSKVCYCFTCMLASLGECSGRVNGSTGGS